MQVREMIRDMLYRFFFKETYLKAARFAEMIKAEVVRQPQDNGTAQNSISSS